MGILCVSLGVGFGWLRDSVRARFEWLWDWLRAVLAWLRHSLRACFGWLRDSLRACFGWLWDWLRVGFGWLLDWLRLRLRWLWVSLLAGFRQLCHLFRVALPELFRSWYRRLVNIGPFDIATVFVSYITGILAIIRPNILDAHFLILIPGAEVVGFVVLLGLYVLTFIRNMREANAHWERNNQYFGSFYYERRLDNNVRVSFIQFEHWIQIALLFSFGVVSFLDLGQTLKNEPFHIIPFDPSYLTVVFSTTLTIVQLFNSHKVYYLVENGHRIILRTINTMPNDGELYMLEVNEEATQAEAARLEAVRLEAVRLEAARLEAADVEAGLLDAARVEAILGVAEDV